jgi:hypothetical protein
MMFRTKGKPMGTILTKLGCSFFAIPLIVFAIEYLARGRWLGGKPGRTASTFSPTSRRRAAGARHQPSNQ